LFKEIIWNQTLHSWIFKINEVNIKITLFDKSDISADFQEYQRNQRVINHVILHKEAILMFPINNHFVSTIESESVSDALLS
jgi:hypothetical protein